MHVHVHVHVDMIVKLKLAASLVKYTCVYVAQQVYIVLYLDLICLDEDR